jgi:Glycosyl transferase family 21
VARQLAYSNLRIIESAPLRDGWSGKLWALEQAWRQVTTRYTLFLDADMKLAPGSIRALENQMQQLSTAFISLTAAPSMASGWEKLLMPAFIYFFKALYPFHRVNSSDSKMAAAAGGCILVETRVLEQIGGFESIKSAVIDDCAFARRVKLQGFKVWLGLTDAVESIRGYKKLREIGDMVARSARATSLLPRCIASLHVRSAAAIRPPCFHDRVFKWRNPLSFSGIVGHYAFDLSADTPILSSIMGLGFLFASHRRVFSCHDLDVGDPVLAR